jgi:hypothetical protein
MEGEARRAARQLAVQEKIVVSVAKTSEHVVRRLSECISESFRETT